VTRSRDTANTQENVGGSVPPFVAGKNRIINSAFQIWQRGTSTVTATSGSTGFLADRWQIWRGGLQTGATATRQVTNDNTNLPDIQYCARVQRDSGTTGTNVIYLTNTFESVNSIPLAGKVVTLSFYARSGANFSSGSNVLTAEVVTGTGTDQNMLSGYTGYAAPLASNVTLTTTWQRFTVTGTLATTATEMAAQFRYTPVGTAGANDYFEMTGVQIELGNVATPFATNTGTIQSELAACQRYYVRFTPNGATNAWLTSFTGAGFSTTAIRMGVPLPVPMRITPTSVEFSAITPYDSAGTAVTAVSAATLTYATPTNGAIDITSLTGAIQYRPYALLSTASTAYLGYSAEL
jgi:hypothetical protein